MPRGLRTRATLAALVALAACTSDDADPPETTVVETTTTVAEALDDDGPLTLGVLLPTTDSQIGQPLIEGVRDAVTRVNRAGGVLGQPVRFIVADEGSTAATATATAAVESLLADGVDAIIGPASSLSALNVLDDIVAEGVLTCSPTAAALSLDEFPDEGLFVRTIPSDSLQASALAQVTEETGVTTAVVAHVDDGYGRPFAEVIEQDFASRAVELVDSIPFDPRDEDLTTEARAVVESGADAAIVIGTGEDSARFLQALDEQDDSDLVRVLVNDAIRAPSAQPLLADLQPEFRERIVGVAPRAAHDAVDDDAIDTEGPYVVNAVDCVNLVALAAVQAESTDGRQIAGRIGELSADGSGCTTFDSCMTIIDNGFNPDYDGAWGVIEIVDGETVRAPFLTFGFDDEGHDVPRAPFVHPG